MESPITLLGEVLPDGTLQLDQAPALPAGRVVVVIRALPQAKSADETWLGALERVRAEYVRSGGPIRTQAEIDREIDDSREDRELN